MLFEVDGDIGHIAIGDNHLDAGIQHSCYQARKFIVIGKHQLGEADGIILFFLEIEEGILEESRFANSTKRDKCYVPAVLQMR